MVRLTQPTIGEDGYKPSVRHIIFTPFISEDADYIIGRNNGRIAYMAVRLKMIIRLEECEIFRDFSENASKLLGKTVFIISEGRVERKWISKNNIWKLMLLWEDGLLFPTWEEAEDKLYKMSKR